MSGSHPSSPGSAAPQSAAADPSMEDILASIRRILSDDEAEAGANAGAAVPPAAPPAAPAAAALPRVVPAPPALRSLPPPEDVLNLDASMIVEEPADRPAPPLPATAAPVPSIEALVAPEAAAAAASSVGTLLRTLIAEREQVVVHRGGPTIEELVREEIRPLLKQWLDTNLPPMVERQVRAEIERVVGRAVS